MSLTPSVIGENPQQPGIFAETFIPDQLIAGDLKIVSEQGTLTGSAPLKRGTVLGRTKYGAVATASGTAAASGTVEIAELPADGDTLTIGGTAIVFKTPVPLQNLPYGEVAIGATVEETAQSLLAFLEGSTDANLLNFDYNLAAATLTLEAALPGTGGNALTLATSNASAFVLSGATLSGGVANTGNATIGSVSAGASLKYGKYLVVCTDATHATVTDPSGAELGEATFGAPFKSPQIDFTITAGATACAAGDTFVLGANPATPGLYKVCTAGATDGSEEPEAILADYTDPSSGDVTCGVYLMGEFNGNVIALDPSLSLANVRTALRRKGIFIKGSVPADAAT